MALQSTPFNNFLEYIILLGFVVVVFCSLALFFVHRHAIVLEAAASSTLPSEIAFQFCSTELNVFANQRAKYNLSAIWVFPQFLSCSLHNRTPESCLQTELWYKSGEAHSQNITMPIPCIMLCGHGSKQLECHNENMVGGGSRQANTFGVGEMAGCDRGVLWVQGDWQRTLFQRGPEVPWIASFDWFLTCCKTQ